MSEEFSFAKHGATVTPRTSVNVRVPENVDLDTIIIIIGGIVGRYGCRTCGLMGYDLALTAEKVE